MKILVTYFSLSANTKKIALAIYDEAMLAGHEVYLFEIFDIKGDYFNNFDLVFLGSACHDADIAEPVKRLLAELPEMTTFMLAGFITHATSMPDGSERNRELYTKWAGKCPESLARASIEKGFELKGYFHCQGAPNPPIADFIHNEIIPDEEEWKRYSAEAVQHPNTQDFENAKQFVRDLLAEIEMRKNSEMANQSIKVF